MKKYKFLFLILFLGIFFFPKDAFAIEINNNGLFCQYSIDGTQTCNQLQRIEFPNGQVGYGGILRPVNNRGINYVAMDFYNQSFCVNENSGGTWNGWIWFENKGDRDLVYASDKIRVHAGTDRFNCSFKKNGDYGIDFLCTLSRPINNETITFDIPYLDMVTPNYLPVAIGIGEWTQGTQKCVLDESSIIANDNKNTDKIIQNQNENQQQTNEKLDKLDDTLNDDDTSSSENQIDGFFNNFEDNHHGLSSVITAPLVFIRNLLNHSCIPLTLKLPFVDSVVNLPCMKSIYQQYFGLFFNLYQTITTGVIAYAVLIRIFAIIKGLQDPQNDKIEVFHL